MRLSRREFLALAAGGTGGVIACVCTGIAAGIGYWLLNREEKSEVIPLATSAVNRVDVNKQIAVPHIIFGQEWGAAAANHEAKNEKGFFSAENPDGWRIYSEDLREIYNTVVIHHSVIDEGDDLASLKEVQRLHQIDRGWADVGYHFLIGKEGSIYEGRPLNVRGVHVAGYNTGTVGVCLIGNFMEDTLSDLQTQATDAIVQWLAVRLQLTHLAGHRDFNGQTVCPGDNLVTYFETWAANAELKVGIDGYIAPAETSHAGFCSCHT